MILEPHDRYRIERGARHLFALGERAIAEILIEGAGSGGDDLARLIDRLQRYERCPTELLRAVGAELATHRLDELMAHHIKRLVKHQFPISF